MGEGRLMRGKCEYHVWREESEEEEGVGVWVEGECVKNDVTDGGVKNRRVKNRRDRKSKREGVGGGK